jgi:hypothetical protein
MWKVHLLPFVNWALLSINMTKNLSVEASYTEFEGSLSNGIGTDTWSQIDGHI